MLLAPAEVPPLDPFGGAKREHEVGVYTPVISRAELEDGVSHLGDLAHWKQYRFRLPPALRSPAGRVSLRATSNNPSPEPPAIPRRQRL
jgi:hypothetical protein